MNTLIIYNNGSADAIASAAILYNVCKKDDGSICDVLGIPRTWNGTIGIGKEGWKYDINMSKESIAKYNSLANYDIYIIGFFADPFFMNKVINEREHAHYYFITSFIENYKDHIKLVVDRLGLKGVRTNSQATTYYNDDVTLYTSKNWSAAWFTFKREMNSDRKPMTIRYINDYTMKTNKFENSRFFVKYIMNSPLVCADDEQWEFILKGRFSKVRKQCVYDSEWVDTINEYIERAKNA